MADWLEITYLVFAASTGALAFRDAPQRLLAAHREGRVIEDGAYHAVNGASVVVMLAWLGAIVMGWDASLLGGAQLPVGVRVAGLALAGLGFALGGWARVALGQAFTPTAAVPDDQRVVTRGPYAHARHPFYAGLMLALLGGVLALDSRATLAVLVVLAPLVRVIAVKEEAHLAEALGEAYEAYRDRVPRWVPRPWRAD